MEELVSQSYCAAKTYKETAVLSWKPYNAFYSS